MSLSSSKATLASILSKGFDMDISKQNQCVMYHELMSYNNKTNNSALEAGCKSVVPNRLAIASNCVN
ncbi:hypothetical protein SAMN05192573_11544 [Mucilaginibacter gossypii]|uniref:Uncharacterized protein n=1 Tax=Mucilaginibacter gossypii TaxID=551996 RepID=A0A1G8H5D7_9SPHI|nr:hypothetical protein SAMN05192573_11544 [Mucilaginibacter gossypii]